jgi:tetratricopeptide (TPR) repeat protein
MPTGHPSRRTKSLLAAALAAAVLAATVGVAPADAGKARTKRAYARNLRGSEEALSAYTLGVYLLERGAYRVALNYLQSAWEESGHSATVGIKLADAYFRFGSLEESEEIVRELLEQDDGNLEAIILQAKIYYLKGNKNEAARILEKAGASGSESFEVYRLLGKIYYEQNKVEEAIRAYEQAIELDPSYPFIFFRYGILLESAGRKSEARDAFRQALKLNPRFDEAALDLSDLLVREGRYAQADSLLSAVLKRNPKNDSALLKLSSMYLEEGKYDDGIRLLEQVRQERALPREGLLILGRLYFEVKEYGEALDIFAPMYAAKKSAELARILGEINLLAGKPDEALRYYREAIDIAPDDYKSYLSLFFATSKRFAGKDAVLLDLPDEEAAALITKASRKVRDDDFDGCYLVGMAYQSLDSLDAARRMLLKAYKLKKDDFNLLVTLAGIEEKDKRFEDAERYLADAYKMKPDDPTVNNFYGYLLAEMGVRLEEAEGMVKRALDVEPENGYYIDSLGWIYYRRGEYDKAIVQLEKASGIVKNDPVILEHLGDTYRALKRYRKALAAYERSRELQGSNEALREKIRTIRDRLD